MAGIRSSPSIPTSRGGNEAHFGSTEQPIGSATQRSWRQRRWMAFCASIRRGQLAGLEGGGWCQQWYRWRGKVWIDFEIDTEGHEREVLKVMKTIIVQAIVVVEIGWGTAHPHWQENREMYVAPEALGYQSVTVDEDNDLVLHPTASLVEYLDAAGAMTHNLVLECCLLRGEDSQRGTMCSPAHSPLNKHLGGTIWEEPCYAFVPLICTRYTLHRACSCGQPVSSWRL